MSFTKIAKVAFLISVITTTVTFSAKANTLKQDWEALMDAIAQVESSGNHRAVHGNSVGIMQITPHVVHECNDILKSRGASKRYTMHDRFSIKKSREMFLLFMSKHNPTNSIEKAIRIWKGGIHYSQRRTQGYYNRVMKIYLA